MESSHKLHALAFPSTAMEDRIHRLVSDYQQSLRSGSMPDDLIIGCRSLFQEATVLLDRHELPASVSKLLRNAALRIHLISNGLADLNRNILFIEQDTRDRLAQVTLGLTPFSTTSVSVQPVGEATFHPYRDYFLAHLGSPYPLGADRDHLLSLVPSHDRGQLDTWFSNTRRRSGWTAFRRDFAFDSPVVLQNLLDNIDAEGNEEAKLRLEGVKRYFDPEREHEVAAPLRELVEKGPKIEAVPSAATTRAEARLAKRAGRGVGAQGERTPKSKKESWSPRRRQRNASATSSASFNTDVEFYSNPTPMALVEEPRYPSTFASPTTSFRSVSNASSASLDSLISYSSSDYTPQIERMEPVSSDFDSTPSSGPSNGYSFPAPRPHFAGQPPTEPAASHISSSSFRSPTRSHPYFCTLSDLSHSSSSSWTELPPLGAWTTSTR